MFPVPCTIWWLDHPWNQQSLTTGQGGQNISSRELTHTEAAGLQTAHSLVVKRVDQSSMPSGLLGQKDLPQITRNKNEHQKLWELKAWLSGKHIHCWHQSEPTSGAPSPSVCLEVGKGRPTKKISLSGGKRGLRTLKLVLYKRSF